MKIIVDAMGGDNAPLAILQGCALAVNEFDIEEMVLAGDEQVIRACARTNGISLDKMSVVDCRDAITMSDEPTCVLKERPDSSMAVGFRLLKEGAGDAFVSAGNTGALTVGATFLAGRIKGVKRPAIASVIPGEQKPFLLMDCGANAECRPEHLCRFGLLGSIYMQYVMGVNNPTVALANNGTEATKGTPIVKEAYAMMQEAPYHFIGNIEGRRIPYGDADVVVADGFTGNLILKTYEGVAKVLMNGIKEAFTKNALSKVAYLGVRSGIDEMKAKFDYKEYGGAVLLGVRKPVIKAHGSADARTFKNAVKQAARFLETDLIATVEKELREQG